MTANQWAHLLGAIAGVLVVSVIAYSRRDKPQWGTAALLVVLILGIFASYRKTRPDDEVDLDEAEAHGVAGCVTSCGTKGADVAICKPRCECIFGELRRQRDGARFLELFILTPDGLPSAELKALMDAAIRKCKAQ